MLRKMLVAVVEFFGKAARILLRIGEGLLWVHLSAGIGETSLSFVGLGSGRFLKTASYTDVLESAGDLLGRGPTSDQLIGLALILIISWMLGDLPIHAIISRGKRIRSTEPSWPDKEESSEKFVIEGFLRRAHYARKMSAATLGLIVFTLIIGMWVFVSAPGAESARAIAAGRAEADISAIAEEIVDLLERVQRTVDTAAKNVKELGAIQGALAAPGTTIDGDKLAAAKDLVDTYNALSNDLAQLQEPLTTPLEQLRLSSNEIIQALQTQPPQSLNSQSTLTRLGSVVILLVALRVLGGLYRASSVLAQQYAATADALLLAMQSGDKTAADQRLVELKKHLSPVPEEPVDIALPIDMMTKLSEKMVDLSSKVAEIAKSIKLPGVS